MLSGSPSAGEQSLVGADDARGEERGPLAGGRTRLPPLTDIPSKGTVEPGDRGYPRNLG
jgi:hypothetical protein